MISDVLDERTHEIRQLDTPVLAKSCAARTKLFEAVFHRMNVPNRDSLTANAFTGEQNTKHKISEKL